MLFEEKKLSRKEKKELEAQQAREDAEYNAKVAASTAKRQMNKLIEKVTKTEKELMESAALAKSKGYADVYRQHLSALKVARGRKVQAEKFLMQIDAMEKMKTIADSSNELLGAMSDIMNTLGRLTIDKDQMRKAQQNFAQTQQNLNKQSMSLDQFFGQMEMMVPEEDEMILDSDSGPLDANLEDEIQAILNAKTDGGANVDSDIAKFQQMFN